MGILMPAPTRTQIPPQSKNIRFCKYKNISGGLCKMKNIRLGRPFPILLVGNLGLLRAESAFIASLVFSDLVGALTMAPLTLEKFMATFTLPKKHISISWKGWNLLISTSPFLYFFFLHLLNHSMWLWLLFFVLCVCLLVLLCIYLPTFLWNFCA